MTAEMKRNTGLHCKAFGAAAGHPCTVDCPDSGLAIAAGTTIEMLGALDLAKMPLAVSAALGVLRSALKAAQQSDTNAAPAPDPGAMLTQPPAPRTWEARFAQFGGPSKEKAMEGEIADWRTAYAAHVMRQRQDTPTAPTDLSKRLREYAANNGYSHNDYADTMRQAADEIERYYGGMMAWKQTAEKKDLDWNEVRMARENDRAAARNAASLATPVASADAALNMLVDSADLDKLEALAKGVPEHIQLKGWYVQRPRFGHQHVYADDFKGHGRQHIATLPADKNYFGSMADFIAAANPATVLKLLAAIRALQKGVKS